MANEIARKLAGNSKIIFNAKVIIFCLNASTIFFNSKVAICVNNISETAGPEHDFTKRIKRVLVGEIMKYGLVYGFLVCLVFIPCLFNCF